MTDAAAPAQDAARARGMLLVFCAGLAWSTVGLGIRLIEEALVWQILLWRSFGLIALLYLVIRWRTGQDALSLARRTGLPGLLGALALVAAYGGGIYAVQTTSVANALLLFATAPFMAAILGLIFLREPVRPITWAAIALAVFGISIMVRDEAASASITGNLAALGSAFGFAVFTVIIRWGRTGEMLPVVFLSGILGIVIMTGICLAMGLPLILTPRDTGISLCMGVFQVGLGLVLYTIGSKAVPAAELTLLSLAEVVLAPLWVWLFLGETASQSAMIGGSILLTAIAANALLGKRRRPPPHV